MVVDTQSAVGGEAEEQTPEPPNPSQKSDETQVFFIAGEASGDSLGASLIRALNSRDDVVCSGVGGPLMECQGFKSLLPMSELCVMGIWEVVWQLRRLMSLINNMVAEIERAQPDVVVTIDLPDFNFRVAKALKKRGIYKGKIVHYVAPSVWAWRPGRAKKISKFLDGLMCLFPFEPRYFEPYELEAEYVGHPLIMQDRDCIDTERFRKEREIKDDEIVLGLFFGSRERELAVHSGILLSAALALKEHYPNICVVAPTTETLEYDVHHVLEDAPKLLSYVIGDQEQKWAAMASCDVAVAVSGTVGLELAYMGVPHVIAYKMHPLTALIVKLLVKVKYAHLANILLDKPIVPELLQGRCKAIHIAKEVFRLLKDKDSVDSEHEGFALLRERLRSDIAGDPSDQAARFVLKHAGRTWI